MWEKYSSPAGLEPALPKGNRLAGHHVNHSAKVTIVAMCYGTNKIIKIIYNY